MDRFAQEKLIEVVLYVLKTAGGLDIYHLFKVLYFAQRDHLATWGSPVIDDDFHALAYGPVPTNLYNAYKKDNCFGDQSLSDLLWGVVKLGKEDASTILFSKRDSNEDYISDSEKQSLDKSIKENSSLSFQELKTKSHDRVWRRASKREGGRTGKEMLPADIAESGGASSGIIEYINDYLDVAKALR